MKYILVTWPEIQEFMERPDYRTGAFYDPEKDVYFVPEDWDCWPKNEDCEVDDFNEME